MMKPIVTRYVASRRIEQILKHIKQKDVKILLKLNLLENQDFEGHDNIIDLRKVNMKLIEYKKMFLGTSQFGIFKKGDKSE